MDHLQPNLLLDDSWIDEHNRPFLKYNVLFSCIPKSGTHLMVEILRDLYGLRRVVPLGDDESVIAAINTLSAKSFYASTAYYGHLRFGDIPPHLVTRKQNWRVITLVRDPRDICLALRDYLDCQQGGEQRAYFDQIRHLDKDQQIMALAAGLHHSANTSFEMGSVDVVCSGWVEWRTIGALMIKYEELQSLEVTALLSRVLHLPTETVRNTIRRCIGRKTSTLNIGKAQRWRDEMSPAVLEHFRKHDGGAVERLGYSWD